MKRSPFRSASAGLIFLSACSGGFLSSSPMSSAGSSGGGATVGGIKDLKLARALVEAGSIPGPDAWAVEGLYAEHDLPVGGAACAEAFCVRAAGAVATDLNGERNVGWVQLGLSSAINPQTLQRPALDLALVIDVSCSMGGEGIKMAREAAMKAIDNLNEGDLLQIVKFDDQATLVSPRGPVVNIDDLKAKVMELRPEGSTCISCGTSVAYAGYPLNTPDPTRNRRVVVITDAMPNVGQTTKTDLAADIEHQASTSGIFTTVVGVSLAFDQDLVRKISAVKGANSHFLGSVDDATKLFGEDFKFWVTPVAHDLDLELRPKAGLAVAAMHGVPGADAAAAKSHIASVFLSRERGALVARLDQAADPGAELGTLSLSYVDVDGQPHSETLTVLAPPDAAPAYDGPSTRKALALTRFALGAQEACKLYELAQPAEAATKGDAVADALEAEAAAMQDPGLQAEAAFARKLADLLGKTR
jgi:Ca-activated chloride channel homolog